MDSKLVLNDRALMKMMGGSFTVFSALWGDLFPQLRESGDVTDYSMYRWHERQMFITEALSDLGLQYQWNAGPSRLRDEIQILPGQRAKVRGSHVELQ
ncbi:hypothetical protein ACPV5S_15505 [Vibrio astriarenae]